MFVLGREEKKSIVICDATTISARKVSNGQVKLGSLAAHEVTLHDELIPYKWYSEFINLLEHLGQ